MPYCKWCCRNIKIYFSNDRCCKRPMECCTFGVFFDTTWSKFYVEFSHTRLVSTKGAAVISLLSVPISAAWRKIKFYLSKSWTFGTRQTHSVINKNRYFMSNFALNYCTIVFKLILTPLFINARTFLWIGGK